MAKKALARVTEQKNTDEEITFIELPPQAQWFSQEVDQAGRRVWFIHIEVTGLLARKFGPFASKRVALLFHDQLLDEVLDALVEAENRLDTYQVPKREFASHHMHYPMVETENTETAKGGRKGMSIHTGRLTAIGR